ncbi:MAG: PTS transporter subunit EIIC [Streptococcaceae bacterium]|jgi:PTS system cellobiose-specific IIC component|nr:PTS transporter subunit EIIC [Streptococcaceae bacterium]
MNGLVNVMEKYMLPVATKVGSQRHLNAIMNAFLAILPITMLGSIITLINVVIRDFPNVILQVLGKEQTYDVSKVPVLADIVNIDGIVWGGTLMIIGLVFAFSWGYHLAKSYKNADPFSGGLVSIASFFSMLTLSVSVDLGVIPKAALKAVQKAVSAGTLNLAVDGKGAATASAWAVNPSDLNANAYLAIMLFCGIAVTLYVKLAQTNLKIKLPELVPPNVSKPFEEIIPIGIAVYGISIVFYLLNNKWLGIGPIQIFAKYIAEPFANVTQSLAAVVIVTAFVHIFWFFGIHGTNTLGGVLDGIWQQPLLNNQEIYNKVGLEKFHYYAAHPAEAKAAGYEITNWVRNSFDIYGWQTGTGATLCLLVAILIFSKRADYRAIAKLGSVPGLFNINEPVMFGLPLVLNVVYIIPFVLTPIVGVVIGYLATAAHFVNPACIVTSWTTPPILNAFLATGFDPKAALLAAVILLIQFLIYIPFVISANKLDYEKEA